MGKFEELPQTHYEFVDEDESFFEMSSKSVLDSLRSPDFDQESAMLGYSDKEKIQLRKIAPNARILAIEMATKDINSIKNRKFHRNIRNIIMKDVDIRKMSFNDAIKTITSYVIKYDPFYNTTLGGDSAFGGAIKSDNIELVISGLVKGVYRYMMMKYNYEPLYFVPKNTAEAFLCSDADALLKDMKLPHNSFYIHVGEDGLPGFKTAGTDFVVVGMYITKIELNENETRGTFLECSLVVLKNGENDYNNSKSVDMLLYDKDGRFKLYNKEGYSSLITEGKETVFSDIIINFIVCSILYITGANKILKEIKPVATNKFLEKIYRKDRLKNGIVKEVCKKTIIVIAPHLDKLHVERKYNKDGTTYILTHQYLVRGHFRLQPYGPRDNPTYERIWIAPFIRGPEGTEFVPRKTIVKAVKE